MDSHTIIQAAALIGAGLGAIGVGVPGIGIGLAAFGFLQGSARQPEMQGSLQGKFFVCAALMEALGLFAFLVAFLLYNLGKGA